MKKIGLKFIMIGAFVFTLFTAGNVHAQQWVKMEGGVKAGSSWKDFQAGEYSIIDYTQFLTVTKDGKKITLNNDKNPLVLDSRSVYELTLGAQGYGGQNYVVIMGLHFNDDEFYKFEKTGGIITIKIQGNSMNANWDNCKWASISKRVSSLDQVMSYLSNSVPTKTIRSVVDKLKNSDKTKYANTEQGKDNLSIDIAAAIVTGATLTSIASDMTPGVFAIPASAAATVSQWALKAQLVYAISYIYGKPKTGDELKADLIFLFADPDMVNDAIMEVAKDVSKDIAKDAAPFVGKQVGAAVRSTAAFKKIEKTVVGKVADKISKKVFGVASSAVAKGALKALGWATMIYNAYKQFKDSVFFSAKAMTYYKYDKLDRFYAATK